MFLRLVFLIHRPKRKELLIGFFQAVFRAWPSSLMNAESTQRTT